MVTDILDPEPDIAIVGNSNQPGDCLRIARDEQAAIILAQDSASDRGTCLDLILSGPPLGVLAVSREGHSAAGVSLVRRPIRLDSASPSTLANAIRRLASDLNTQSSRSYAAEAPADADSSGGSS